MELENYFNSTLGDIDGVSLSEEELVEGYNNVVQLFELLIEIDRKIGKKCA